jgi:hypothetical protein
MIHSHSTMPEVELIEEVRVDVEEIKRRRIWKSDDLHVAKQQEKIVQLVGLQAQLALVAPVGHAVEKIAQIVADGHEVMVAGRQWGR